MVIANKSAAIEQSEQSLNKAKKRKKASQGAVEIDTLFATAKAAKTGAKTSKLEVAGQVKLPSTPKGSKDDIFGTESAEVRRRTAEGFRIYSEEELRLNGGGDTDLCPFDCSCCY